MAPPINRKEKKRKIEDKQQSAAQDTADKLATLSLTITPPSLTLAKDLLSPLKPGFGLLGNPQEEQNYYDDYVKAAADEIKQSHAESDNDADSDHALDEDGIVQYEHQETEQEESDPEELDKEDIDLGDFEELEFGRDYIEIDGEHIHATKYFGKKWTQQIHDLYAVKPLPHPENMNVVLHDYQLKGAAQLQHLCRSRFKGGILADPMGLGKTLTTITLMWQVKDEPGFSVVAAPKALCLQWVDAIEGAWQDAHGLKAYLIEGSSVTAHELLARGVDVIVCSYDQLETSQRAQRHLTSALDEYNNHETGKFPMPKRPNAALHSSFWKEMDLPIKILILDEAQVVNKRGGVRHQAVKKLNAKAVVALSGTPGHNKWHNFSGLVDFLRGHPFTSHRLFMKAFATQDYDGKLGDPDLPRMRLIQRFIQAFTIARPADILKLPACTRYRSNFEIRESVLKRIDNLVYDYKQAVVMNKRLHGAERESDSRDAAALSLAVQAQLLSLHPMLREDDPNKPAKDDDDAMNYGENEYEFTRKYNAADAATKAGAVREQWLKGVKDRERLIQESDRLLRFLRVYQQLRRSRPDQRILVFSQYLKFLDIIHEAMNRVFGVVCLRFDGTVGHQRRIKVQQEFQESDPSVPLLMTAGSGAYGLNVTQASIVIQCEIWWNLNVEWQAICRVHRQKQEREVLAVQLFAYNSEIDREILSVQGKKASIVSELMEPIIRRDDEEPDIRDLIFPVRFTPMTL